VAAATGLDRPPAARLSVRRTLPPKLRAAYERALYRVDTPQGAIVLRVGSKSAALDRLLAAHGVVTAALLSAANPGSRPLSASANRRRHRKLRARVAAVGYRFLPGESSEAKSGTWREASLLVLGFEREEAIALARELGQVAILVARAGQAVRLVEVDRGAPSAAV
jgi:hypothetical protein